MKDVRIWPPGSLIVLRPPAPWAPDVPVWDDTLMRSRSCLRPDRPVMVLATVGTRFEPVTLVLVEGALGWLRGHLRVSQFRSL